MPTISFILSRLDIVCLISLSAGKWSIPTTTGCRPPPSCYFSFTAISDHLAVLFGGEQPGCRGRASALSLPSSISWADSNLPSKWGNDAHSNSDTAVAGVCSSPLHHPHQHHHDSTVCDTPTTYPITLSLPATSLYDTHSHPHCHCLTLSLAASL